MMPMTIDFSNLAKQIKTWGISLGFQEIGITDTTLLKAEQRLLRWLEKSYHGTMDYMQRHGLKRSQPETLVPGTLRIITARMDYHPPHLSLKTIIRNPLRAVISRYALGRDYHKLIRKRLEKLAQLIQENIALSNDPKGAMTYRVFTDSAPVMEKPLAEKAGLGWIGKHTNLIHSQAGSWFFLGVIYTNLPLPIDKPASNHCGSCQACIDICPTQAIVAPYELDARRCISYLTIELRGAIPIELRPLIGNRIYGCDDCQIVCPWNKFAKFTKEDAFHPRERLAEAELLEVFKWTEAEFLRFTEGSAIRRIGYVCWLRNIAVALGNAPYQPEIMAALEARLTYPNPLVQEHVQWAMDEQCKKNEVHPINGSNR